VGVELVDFAKIIAMLDLPGLALNVFPDDRIYRSHNQITLGGPRDQRAHEIVVWAIRRQTLLQHVVEELHTATHLPIGPKQVHVEIRPLVHERRTANQTVNQARPFVGRSGLQKAQKVCRSGNAASEIQRDAPKELLVGADGVGMPSLFHFPENVVVDEITTRNSLDRPQWFRQTRG
jgi:hypothetical protein